MKFHHQFLCILIGFLILTDFFVSFKRICWSVAFLIIVVFQLLDFRVDLPEHLLQSLLFFFNLTQLWFLQWFSLRFVRWFLLLASLSHDAVQVYLLVIVTSKTLRIRLILYVEWFQLLRLCFFNKSWGICKGRSHNLWVCVCFCVFLELVKAGCSFFLEKCWSIGQEVKQFLFLCHLL